MHWLNQQVFVFFNLQQAHPSLPFSFSCFIGCSAVVLSNSFVCQSILHIATCLTGDSTHQHLLHTKTDSVYFKSREKKGTFDSIWWVWTIWSYRSRKLFYILTKSYLELSDILSQQIIKKYDLYNFWWGFLECFIVRFPSIDAYTYECYSVKDLYLWVEIQDLQVVPRAPEWWLSAEELPTQGGLRGGGYQETSPIGRASYQKKSLCHEALATPKPLGHRAPLREVS